MIKKIKGSKTVIEFGDKKLELNSIENTPIITYPKELIEENPLPDILDKVYSIELILKEENNVSKNQ